MQLTSQARRDMSWQETLAKTTEIYICDLLTETIDIRAWGKSYSSAM